MLDPSVVLRADEVAVQTAAANRWGGGSGLSAEVHGARAVADVFDGSTGGVEPALIDGCAGAAWTFEGQARAAWVFTIDGGRILEIELVMNPHHLASLMVAPRSR